VFPGLFPRSWPSQESITFGIGCFTLIYGGSIQALATTLEVVT
jgi:hypothetical protein